jgi:hypothetical protein
MDREQFWCVECHQEYRRWIDENGELAVLSIRHRDHDKITSASREEWEHRFNEIAPKVEEHHHEC